MNKVRPKLFKDKTPVFGNRWTPVITAGSVSFGIYDSASVRLNSTAC